MTVYATDVGGDAGGESRGRGGESRGREKREEQSRRERRRADGGGEETAGVRNGREARPFFDPKRGQLGANFSGGTGLTRPPGILTGAARRGALSERNFAEKTEGDTLLVPSW